MASRQTSRTLATRRAHFCLDEPALSVATQDRSELHIEAVQTGADSATLADPASTLVDGALEGANKRQRLAEPSTIQHRAAPVGDHAAPQGTISNGTAPPRLQPACEWDALTTPSYVPIPGAKVKWTYPQKRLA